MAAVAIRDMVATDLDHLIDIERRATNAPRSRDIWQREHLAPAFAVLVAEQGSAAVGYLGYSLAGGEASINHLAVLPESRRQGVARALLTALFSDLVRHAAREIFLDVRSGNEGACRLYQRCGFTQVGCRARYYTDPVEDALIYRRAV